MDTPTFELKREEIQRRIQTRRLALEPMDGHRSSGFWKMILNAVAQSDLLGTAQTVGQARLVRNIAGAAVSYMLTRWARKAFK